VPPPRYRAAIIGTGRVGSLLERDPLRPKPHTHAGWYASCPRTELVAGCDVDDQRREAFARDWNVPSARLFRDYREMLARVRPDIVSICAYASERRAMVEAAIEHGVRGLWIEKALACSLRDAEAMVHALARGRVAAVVNQPRRGEGRYRAVADAVERGTWGRLQSVHCVMSGHLMHTGTHAWDVLRLWCGPWVAASAWLSKDESPARSLAAKQGGSSTPEDQGQDTARRSDPASVRGESADDCGGHAHVRFEQGAHAFVSGGLKDYFVFQFDAVFEGARVRLGNDVDELWQPASSPRYSGFRELACTGPVPVGTPSVPPLLDLVDAMDRGCEPRQSVSDALEAFALGVALFQSDLEGHRSIGRGDVRHELYVASV
jgi:predicted dehydrogenase